MIRGIGFDVVRIERISALVSRRGERFAERLLLPSERVLWEERGRTSRFLAGRFAAKEAIVKALGTGFTGGIGLRTIAVLADPAGRPRVWLGPLAEDEARARGIRRFELSLSDEGGWVFALALALAD